MDRSIPISSSVARKYTGAWVAWNRDQTKIVGSGPTFDEAKRAAARGGETSVISGRIPTSRSWLQKSRRLIHMVAVFVSLAPVGLSPGDAMARAPADAGQVVTIEDLDDGINAFTQVDDTSDDDTA